jgi:hypothetical protein
MTMKRSKWANPGVMDHHKAKMAEAWADPVKRRDHGEKISNSPDYRRSMATRSEALRLSWQKRAEHLGLTPPQRLIYRRIYRKVGRNLALEVAKQAQKNNRCWASRFAKALPVAGPIDAMKIASGHKIAPREMDVVLR